MKMLRGRLYEMERQRREAEFEKTYGSTKTDIDMGSQIRSYTMSPYTLVKDERSEHKVTQIDKVLDGELDELIEAYLLMRANRKANGGKNARN
jgi:peptide chain release factor 2